MQFIWAFPQAVSRRGVTVALFSILVTTAVSGSQSLENSGSTTVRGVVLDSETKKPILHATVYVDRDDSASGNDTAEQQPTPDDQGKRQVTDSDGSFSFQGLGFNSHTFDVAKDGYVSATPGRAYSPGDGGQFSVYEVHVGPGTGEIRLFLTPAAKIQGRVVSEAGQPMKNMLVTLYTGVVEDGRTMWRRGKVVPTDGNGFYSFANLEPGIYVVLTDWVFDNDPDPPHGTDCGTMKFTPTGGYPPAANPGVLNFAGTRPIHLGAGHIETTDFKLSHREFQTVTWLHNGELSPQSFRTLRDGNGRNLRMVSPPESHCGRSMPEKVEPGIASPPQNMLINGRETIHLPDGDYTLLTGSGFPKDKLDGQSTSPRLGYYAHFTVAGKPLTLSYPTRPARSEPAVTFRIQEEGRPDGIPPILEAVAGSALWLTRADPLPEYTRPIPLMRAQDNNWVFYLEAGSYWVHPGDLGTAYDGTHVCIASVTAAGADMSREPLVVGLDGRGPELQLTATYHCGILHLDYGPANSNEERYGVVRSFYGFLVPQFSAFETVHKFLFESGHPQEITLGNLLPGHYKFYVSPGERSFAFRENSDVPADLGPGQEVWLKPGEKIDVSVADPPEE